MILVCDWFSEHAEGLRASREDHRILFADLGYEFKAPVDIDFIFPVMDRTTRNLPWRLTKSEMEDEPSQANRSRYPDLETRSLSTFLLADKLSFATEEDSVDGGCVMFQSTIRQTRGFFRRISGKDEQFIGQFWRTTEFR